MVSRDYFSSAQGDICALGKAHMRSAIASLNPNFLRRCFSLNQVQSSD